jgi:septal ring factor EnvC (AmiA/AmiB activator)
VLAHVLEVTEQVVARRTLEIEIQERKQAEDRLQAEIKERRQTEEELRAKLAIIRRQEEAILTLATRGGGRKRAAGIPVVGPAERQDDRWHLCRI